MNKQVEGLNEYLESLKGLVSNAEVTLEEDGSLEVMVSVEYKGFTDEGMVVFDSKQVGAFIVAHECGLGHSLFLQQLQRVLNVGHDGDDGEVVKGIGLYVKEGDKLTIVPYLMGEVPKEAYLFHVDVFGLKCSYQVLDK